MSMDGAAGGEDERREQLRMLVDSAGGIALRHGDFGRVRSLRFKEPGIDRDVWRIIAEMGWLGLNLPEESGGAGLGMMEYAALVRELGAALVPEPVIEAQLAITAMQGATPGSVLSGDQIVLPAWSAEADGLAPGDRVVADSGGRLSGRKIFVPMAAAADRFLVMAGAGLYLVDANAEGLSLTTRATQDGGHVGELAFDGVAGEAVEGSAELALEEAAVANAAYCLGVMERALAITLEYLQTRVQFDRPIGSFQVLQHRAVDMKIETEVTRSAIDDAVRVLEEAQGKTSPQLRATVSRVKARAADAVMFVTRQGIQLHGAIGYTDEADISLLIRKALTLVNRYGSASWHRKRYARVLATEREEQRLAV